MMDFIYELYQNDNFVLYLTIALVILIVLFVLVLIFGKRDQKLEETKRLQKIDVDAFKEEKSKEEKVEVPIVNQENVTEVVEDKKEETKPEEKIEEKEVKSIFDDTQVLPIANASEKKIDEEEVKVTTFEPIKVDENKENINSDEENKNEEKPVKPLLDIEEEDKPIKLDEINFDDLTIEKDLGELENIKKEFDNIKIPEVKDVTSDKKEEKVIERNETKPFKPGPQIFSSVFVKKEDPVVEEKKEEKKEENKPEEKVQEKPTTSLFSIQDDDEDIELPPLKMPNKKEETKESKTFNFDDITGETYNIK